jgi:hypothetical protein
MFLSILSSYGSVSDKYVDVVAFNWSMAQVESANNPHLVGPVGELGVFQFTSTTWYQHTKTPFSHAVNTEISNTVATRHTDWICAQLVSKGITPTAAWIALCWNYGAEGATSGRVTKKAKQYSERVDNLYQERIRKHSV